MNLKFKKPDLVKALQQPDNFPFWLELIIFVGIFYLIQLITLIPQMICVVAVVYLGIDDLAFADPVVLQAQIMERSTPYLLLLQSFTIYLVILFCRLFFHRPAWTLGFKKRNLVREYAIGAGLGLGLMSLIVGLGVLTGGLSVTWNPEISWGMLAVFFVGYLIQGMSEEVLFRGYLIPVLARKKEKYALAILVSALLFALAHILNAGITLLAFLNLTLFGIFAGVYFLKRGDLWGIGAIHALWNFTQGNVWGVLVSGLRSGPSLFLGSAQPGMDLLSGGSFGLEGGFPATAVLILAILGCLMLPQKDWEEA